MDQNSMDLIRCPRCGWEYSPSYRSCPFCEEGDGDVPVKRAAKRHITSRQKAQSARGGIIVVLVLVLALFGWYLFGGKAPEGEAAPSEPAVEAAKPAQTQPAASGPESADGATDGEEAPESAENTEQTAPVHVDASSLSIKTNVGTTLPKDPMTGYYDCSLRKTDQIRLIVSGTDADVSGWKSENTGIVSVDDRGALTLNGSGVTNVIATVGDATVTCIVRVR